MSMSNKQKINTVINELKTKFTMLSPILNNFHFKKCDFIDTMGVDSNGNGVYNSDFISKIQIEQLKGVILHEAFHVVMKHLARWAEYNNYSSFNEFLNDNNYELHKNFKLYNIASDAVINENIINYTPYLLLDGAISLESIANMTNTNKNELLNMSSFELYELLVDSNVNFDDNDNNSNNQKDTNNNDSNNSQDNSESNSNTNSVENEEKKQKIIQKEYNNTDDNQSENNDLTGAYNDTKIETKYLCKGSSSNDIDFNKILTKTSDDWTYKLRSFVDTIAGNKVREKTYRRPSRKYRDIYPISRGKTKAANKKVLFSIDASPSMDEDKILKAVSVINTFTNNRALSCDYCFFSDEYSDIYHFSNINKLKKDYNNNLGNGTSFSAAIREKDVNNNIDNIVIISDMEFYGSDTNSIKNDIKNTKLSNYMFLNIDITNNIIKDLFNNTDHYAEIN